MKKTFLAMLAMMIALTVNAASTKEENMPDDKLYDVVEVMPEYPGGMVAMMRFLQDNVQYPFKASKQNINGRVVVQFIVEKDGRVGHAKIARSVHPLLDEEALRVVRLMPKWTPGKQKGKPVRVKFNIPITFRLK
ncbi:MAG: energy transducer TonB [Prevotellaceae bacterium]|nr:energy transducer TonB [Prevotella sp.]MDD7257162.1 energy transducer TonB [Prevotellaceae bacterium]MDY6130402.1 energy transducer TonB [Prevotella sp.]